MNTRNVIVTIGMSLVFLGAILLAFVLWGDLSSGGAIFLFIGAALVMGAVIGGMWFWKSTYILVNELETAVINHKNGNFAYFIDSNLTQAMGKRPYNLHNNRQLNRRLHKRDKFHHFIHPTEEYVAAHIPKKPLSVTETIENIRTKEGIPIKISWTINYKLDVAQINSGLETNMSRALPAFNSNMMKGNTTQILRHIIEQKSVKSLYADGAIEKLEAILSEKIDAKMSKLGFTNIDPRVGPILVPKAVENAIQEAHERELKTETTVICLDKIKQAIRTYHDNDLARLAELERLRLLDQHGASMIMNIPGMGFPSD